MKRFLITLLSLALLSLLAACTQEDGDREPGRPAVAVALDTGSALSREDLPAGRPAAPGESCTAPVRADCAALPVPPAP